MGIRQYKPTSAGRRGGSVSDFADCTHPLSNRPEKSLLAPRKKKGGRNNQGIVTSRFRGGGHKKMYRIIDFRRRKDNVWATVASIEYDPNRSARIDCRATIGVISNADHMNISLGKAGRTRWMGRKPHNRGTSQNPVSHPMGGGEGRTAGGRHPCGPTGVLAKGGKTRKRRKPSNKAIIRRRRPGPHYAQS